MLEANKLSTWIHGGVCLRVICLHILENHRHKYEKKVDSGGTELAFRYRVWETKIQLVEQHYCYCNFCKERVESWFIIIIGFCSFRWAVTN